MQAVDLTGLSAEAAAVVTDLVSALRVAEPIVPRWAGFVTRGVGAWAGLLREWTAEAQGASHEG